MPETAVYDLVSFDHQNLGRKQHFGTRSAAMLAVKPHAVHRPAPQSARPAPQIVYNSCSDSEEDDGEIYESLEQMNYRKSVENAQRQAKISKVRRTGHPLFDHLREETALKDNTNRRSHKNSFQQSEKTSEFNRIIKNMKLYADPKSLKNKKNAENNYHLNFDPAMIPRNRSLQHLAPPDRNRNARKTSEHHVSQTLPKQLMSSKKFAKSEQNLMTLHPSFMHRPHPMYQPYGPHGHPAMFHNRNPMSLKRQVHPSRVSPNKPLMESSDSDSDWIIPRPKLSQIKIGKNRNSNESEKSGNLSR